MKSLNNKTGFKGVYPRPNGRFRAIIFLFSKRINLGDFNTAEEAAEVYDVFYEKYRNNSNVFTSFIHKNNQQTKKFWKTKKRQTGYFGVKYDERRNNYCAHISVNNKFIFLGNYENPGEAALAVNRYIDRFNLNTPKNDISINDLIIIKRKEKEYQQQLIEYEEEKEMRKPRIKGKHGKEWKIQRDIIRYLEDRNWMVKVVCASLFNYGFPDLLVCHAKYGIKLIEVKVATSFRFTPAQLRDFKEFISHGAPIYILTAANEENYQRLFRKSNLWIYLGGFNDGK